MYVLDIIYLTMNRNQDHIIKLTTSLSYFSKSMSQDHRIIYTDSTDKLDDLDVSLFVRTSSIYYIILLCNRYLGNYFLSKTVPIL